MKLQCPSWQTTGTGMAVAPWRRRRVTVSRSFKFGDSELRAELEVTVSLLMVTVRVLRPHLQVSPSLRLDSMLVTVDSPRL